jgi:hypothetical protein
MSENTQVDDFQVPNYDDPAVIDELKKGNVSLPPAPETQMGPDEFVAGLRAIPEILENMSHGNTLKLDGERGHYGMGAIGNVGYVVEGFGVVGDITVSKLIELAIKYTKTSPVGAPVFEKKEACEETPAEIPELQEFPE